MNTANRRIGIVVLGIAIFAIPVAALAYRFGAGGALSVLVLVLSSYVTAQLAVSLFMRRNPAAKTAAIVLHSGLLFTFFLPAHLKQSLARLKEEEASRSGESGKRDL